MVGRMPKYFFDAYDGRQHCVDAQGEHLDDDREACAQAHAILNALISEDQVFGKDRSYHVSVRRQTTLICQVDYSIAKAQVTKGEIAHRAYPNRSRDYLGSERS